MPTVKNLVCIPLINEQRGLDGQHLMFPAVDVILGKFSGIKMEGKNLLHTTFLEALLKMGNRKFI
jgi:hypothetical protein